MTRDEVLKAFGLPVDLPETTRDAAGALKTTVTPPVILPKCYTHTLDRVRKGRLKKCHISA